MSEIQQTKPLVPHDVPAILHLLAAYCHALDGRQYVAMVDLFTLDATLTARLAGSVHRGHLEICNFFQCIPETMRGLHLTSNAQIDFTDTGAHVRSDFVLIVPRATQSQIAAWGWYSDDVTYESGIWRFRERHIESQWRLTEKA
jgi:hypothetical protein